MKSKNEILPSWLDTNIYPFENRFIEIDGNRVHFVDEGKGPVLLLLHGNPSWSFLYRHIIKGLSGKFRCVALDYPGFGLSKARQGYDFKPRSHSQIVEKFVESLKLRDIRLMVQDWGGPIGLGFAGRRPELIHSLFICNTWAWPAQESKGIAAFSKIAGNAFSRFLIMRFNLFAAVLVPMAITRKLTRAEYAAYTKPYPNWGSRRPTAIFPYEILASKNYLEEVKQGLVKLRDKKILLLWGDADTGFKALERERFERIFPKHKTEILKGAKHYVQEDAPDQICKAVLAFEGQPSLP